jgi:hypothetical protein
MSNPINVVDPDGMEATPDIGGYGWDNSWQPDWHSDYTGGDGGTTGGCSQGGASSNVKYYAFRQNSNGTVQATSVSAPSGNGVPLALEEEIRKLIKSKQYIKAVDKIIDYYKNDFGLSSNQKWDHELNTVSTAHRTLGVTDGSQITAVTWFSTAQLDQFVTPDDPDQGMQWGDMVANIYHEYAHMQDIYADALRVGHHMSNAEYEFRGLSAGLTGKYGGVSHPDLPGYQYGWGAYYLGQAQQFWERIPSSDKSPELNSIYHDITHNLRYSEKPIQ